MHNNPTNCIYFRLRNQRADERTNGRTDKRMYSTCIITKMIGEISGLHEQWTLYMYISYKINQCTKYL